MDKCEVCQCSGMEHNGSTSEYNYYNMLHFNTERILLCPMVNSVILIIFFGQFIQRAYAAFILFAYVPDIMMSFTYNILTLIK